MKPFTAVIVQDALPIGEHKNSALAARDFFNRMAGKGRDMANQCKKDFEITVQICDGVMINTYKKVYRYEE